MDIIHVAIIAVTWITGLIATYANQPGRNRR